MTLINNNLIVLCPSRAKRGDLMMMRHRHGIAASLRSSQRSRCGEIGLPKGEKMPTYNKIENMEESLNLGYEKNNIKSSYHYKENIVSAVFMNNSG